MAKLQRSFLPLEVAMPCLLVLLALFAPRLVLALLFVFSNFVERAFMGWLWPLVGFFFAPVSTLTYAVAINWHGSVTGGYAVLCVLGALMDLGVLGGGVHTRTRSWRSNTFTSL